MNYLPSYIRAESLSNGAAAMASQFHSQKYFERPSETEQSNDPNINLREEVTIVNRKQFSFLWNITNFKQFMDRQYEFTSPIFCEDLSSGASKWKMVIHPQNLYPEGAHIALQISILSEVKRSYPVKYTVSFVDECGKHHNLKTREKVFRKIFDFDDCSIISHISLKDKKLLSGNSLIIKCEFDLLECENQEDSSINSSGSFCSSLQKSSEELDSSAPKSFQISDGMNYQNEKVNIPAITQSMNDLSFSKPLKKPSDSDKELNTLITKEKLFELTSGEFDKSVHRIKGLEMLSNDLKHLYYDTKQHDVVIYADDGKVTAHEIILTSRSDYFKKALRKQENKELDIPGIDMETLDAVLYYLYTGKLKQMTESSALDVVKASQLLGLDDLEIMTTETFLCPRIKTNNVTSVFLMAKELKIESLKTSALKFIAENREEVTKTEQWNELMKKNTHAAGEILLTLAYYENKVPNNASSI